MLCRFFLMALRFCRWLFKCVCLKIPCDFIWIAFWHSILHTFWHLNNRLKVCWSFVFYCSLLTSFWRPGALCVRFENCVLLGLFSPEEKRLKEQEGGLCTSSNESAFQKYCPVFFKCFFLRFVFTSGFVFTIFFCRSATDTGSFTTMTGTDWAIDRIHFGSSSCKSKAIRR